MKNGTSQHFTILLLSLVLTSGSGCQVLQIPSYRADVVDRFACQESSFDTQSRDPSADSYCSNPSSLDPADPSCPPSLLPPIPVWNVSTWAGPAWYVDWKARRALPEPPAYPRFHPLPTRPMFQPAPAHYPENAVRLAPADVPWDQTWESSPPNSTSAPIYGQLPGNEAGGTLWQRSPQQSTAGHALPSPDPQATIGRHPTPAPALIPESIPAPLPLNGSPGRH